jgi:hypothetical protein
MIGIGKIGKLAGSLLPKNTILSKALKGDVKGAVKAGINYVKSGELKTDIANVKGKNLGAIIGKAVGSKKVLGNNVSSLAQTLSTEQISNTEKANQLGAVALAQGSGVTNLSMGMASDVGGGTEQKADIKRYLPYILGGIAVLYFVIKK